MYKSRGKKAIQVFICPPAFPCPSFPLPLLSGWCMEWEVHRLIDAQQPREKVRHQEHTTLQLAVWILGVLESKH